MRHLRSTQTVSLASLTAILTITGLACNVDPLWQEDMQQVVAADANAPGTSGVDMAIMDAREVDLIEAVLRNREQYHHDLRRLAAYYESRGRITKQGWAEFELKGLRGVKAFRYILEAEIPAESLSPVDAIAEADALYEQGLTLMQEGGHGVPVVYRQKIMVEAATLFRKLIDTYPTSDKIDDAAYHCGEIHEEYLPGQESLAVRWYERAWTWNPDTPFPARFQAAVVYDYRLHDRDQALELYREVLARGTDKVSHLRRAMRRVKVLTRDTTTANAAGRS